MRFNHFCKRNIENIFIANFQPRLSTKYVGACMNADISTHAYMPHTWQMKNLKLLAFMLIVSTKVTDIRAVNII